MEATMLLRWESETRYYIVHAQTDLFGQLTLRRFWGGLGSARGGQMTEIVDGPNSETVSKRLLSRLVEIDRIRRRRGYRQHGGHLAAVSAPPRLQSLSV